MGTKRKLPFGYKMESGRIAVDATESHWVSHLFSRYNMGVSIQELANFMNDANLIAMSISTVLVDGNGNVKIRLKNDQIVERGEQNG